MSAELVCIGLATLDAIVVVPRWPERDGRQLVGRLVRAGGGPAATAAVAAARLGRSVAFVGGVGDDDAGTVIQRGLADEGVDVTLVAERRGPSPESVILVDGTDGSRSILHAPGVADGRGRELAAAARAACARAAWVHVDHAGWSLATDLPRSRLSVDAGNPVPGLELDGLGLYGPTGAALAARYPGLAPLAGVARARADGAERVVVTLGADGAVAADGEGAWRVARAPVEVVSTLGAGDVFHGALLAGLIDGLPLPAALRLANVAAALSCRAVDARSTIPDRAALEVAIAGSPPVEPIALEPAG